MKYLLLAIGFFLGLMGCAKPEKMSLINALDIENTTKETDWRMDIYNSICFLMLDFESE
ncbi:hypothetical protein [Arenibacter certesii]|uniref:Uncharacterized protein n=1 Tax=Arenibacter certesii TaxID=228955 RepID=A0A918MPM2_9FLAO|nr:hypothetical protein [Arenibacter certesii]GGW41867.1 hypothetical protein GCM10007383_28120 [Arenibacter certesii]